MSDNVETTTTAAFNKTRAIIIVSNDNNQTRISFNDAPLIPIENELHPLALEDAYYNYTRYYNDSINNQEPFSFLSPYVESLCIVDGIAFRAAVLDHFHISCSNSTIAEDAVDSLDDWTDNNENEMEESTIAPKIEDFVLTPNHGPQSGGTSVKVSGFGNRTATSPTAQIPLCRFGNDTFSAETVDWESGYMICTSPPSSKSGFESSIEVDISLSGEMELFTDIGVIFQYDADVRIHSVHPSSGPVTGGTLVKLHGGQFQNRGEIICRFGNSDVVATYHDDNEISCIAPIFGWVDEVQRVSVFSMANSPEIQTITATVDDYNEVHTCQTFGEDVSDDEFGRGFRLVAPGGSTEYPLTRHTRWLHFNETSEGMEDALRDLFPEGFYVNRTTMGMDDTTFQWDIVLPKTFTFSGETLHVVETGGGSVQLNGVNASVSCELTQLGTQSLGGYFKLSFDVNGSIEETRPILYNATSEEMKLMLEELDGIGKVMVDFFAADNVNRAPGNYEAFQWHVTFDSLKNAGDIPLLNANVTSLEGSNAAIHVLESKRGVSHSVYKTIIPSNVSSFQLVIDGVEGEELMIDTSAEEVMGSLYGLGRGSVAVEKFHSEYYLLDTMGGTVGDNLQVNLQYCDENDGSQVCTSELHDLILHVDDTATTLGGDFTLQYPSKGDSCKTCQHSTDRISVFATAAEIEAALEGLSLVSDVYVTITESNIVNTFKVPVQSGIVGANRNFYIHFRQQELSPSVHDDDIASLSTYFAGDLPELIINRNYVRGTPTKDTAFSEEYNAIVAEIVKGTDLDHSGSVELTVSINGGADFSKEGALFQYNGIPIVHKVIPSHGSIHGGTEIRVIGNNFSRDSAHSCLFSRNNISGFIATSPVLRYVGTGEVICAVPAAEEPQLVSVSIIGSDGTKQWIDTEVQRRSASFDYHEPIGIIQVTPNMAETIGGTVVNVKGGTFFPDENLSCMFGTKVVPASFVNPREVTCMTPQHAAGVYSISVTQNGQDYEEFKSSFYIHNTLRVDGIQPAFGPSRSAGTNVRVYGENFVNTTSLQCRFGFLVVPAVFRSSSEVHCRSPPIDDSELTWMKLPNQMHNGTSSSNELFPLSHFHPSYLGKLVSFEITNNGHDFTNTGSSFLYQMDIQVHSLSREGGPSNGGTPLFVRGSHFGKKQCSNILLQCFWTHLISLVTYLFTHTVNNTQLSCQFGKERTKAFFLTRDAILCFSPPFIGSGHRSTKAERTVPLFVSNNVVDLAHGGHYTYSSLVTDGMYQAGVEGDSTLLICPRGTYCASGATNFTLCTPGTYQPSIGQNLCISCPIGYVCSEFGMMVPRICAAGYGECDSHYVPN